MKHLPFFDPPPRILAHRGDSAFHPENTLPAFLSARDIGVDVIETDVHLTADGKVIIWHDDTLDRETDGSGPVEALTLKELQQLDAGYNFTTDHGASFPRRGRGITLASLDEVLETLPDMRFNIDLKSENPELADAFSAIVRRHNAEKRILGASFRARVLKNLRRMLPDLATSYATGEVVPLLIRQKLGLRTPEPMLPGAALQVPEYFGKIRVITPGFIRHFRKAGLFIHVWTVNEASEMHRFLDMGVDGIFTDNPRLLSEVLAERA